MGDLHRCDASTGKAGADRWSALGLHPAHGRLHHRNSARWREGQHGRSDGGQPVPDRPELGARLGDGGGADPHHPGHGGDRVLRGMAGHPADALPPTPGAGRRAMKQRTSVFDTSLKVWSGLVFGFLFAPIIVILVYSFNTGRLLVSFSDFGFESFAAIVTKPAIRDAVLVSLQAGIISAIIATLLGTLAGVAL